MSLRKVFIFPFMFVIFCCSVSFAESSYTAGDVIVVFRSSGQVTSSSSEVKSAASLFAETNGASLMKTYPALSRADNSIFALIHSDDIDPEKFSQELLKNPDVIAASPNHIVRAAVVPNDTYMSDLWGLQNIGMTDVWDNETGNNDVYVAILDSGIDWTNPELTANTAKDLGFTAKGIPASSYKGFDNYGHGTHVAGTIGAESNNRAGVAGINWHVSMIPVKVLDHSGGGTIETVIEGMNYIANLMYEGYNIRAVNLSLEFYAPIRPIATNMMTYPVWRAFKAVDEYNRAVIVVAAGNHEVALGQTTTYTKRDSKGNIIFEPGYYAYPASFTGLNNMISVAAVNRSGNISSYSNTKADISAPGGDMAVDGSIIVSTWIQRSNYVTDEGIAIKPEQGTSMAAPHVSGIAALLSAHDPSMTAYQIKQCIIGGAVAGGEDITLDAAGAFSYQEYYGSELASEGRESYGYENWRDYEGNNNNNNGNNGYYDYDYFGKNNDSSSGGCNGFMLGAIAVMIFCPLARKFMS